MLDDILACCCRAFIDCVR
uniref:Uncharacterized protein n=1 Tax=Rhizophora mucronata TaxID=61149 RepID=A0A2P2QGC7_RHIMU